MSEIVSGPAAVLSYWQGMPAVRLLLLATAAAATCFTCHDQSACVDLDRVCDGKYDCVDK